MTRRARLALVLPGSMVARVALETPILPLLARRDDLEVCLLTPYAADAATIAAQNAPHLSWAELGRPVPGVGLGYGGPGQAIPRLLQRVVARLTRPWVGFGQLVWRFNHLQGFAGHRHKMKLPPEARAREAQAGNFVEPSLGQPWPDSPAMFQLIKRLHFAPWYSEPSVEAFLDRFAPDLMVLHHVQMQAIRPYVCAARRRGIPMLGIVASWDQPTTKGPLPPGMGGFLVQSQRMREELAMYHGIDPAQVEVTGWPQMDVYFQPGVLLPRQEFLSELGLDPQRRFILLGANTARLGAHEPSIAAHLAEALAQGRFGGDVTLIIRPHPKDQAWQTRLGHLHAPPRVMVLPAEMGRLNFLANLLKHASLVVASSGSIALDALALDTPVVNLAFDGDLTVDYHRSVARWLELDHYRPVVQSGGVRLANSFSELEQAVAAYLDDPSLDSQGRAKCRAQQLDPLDGQASARMVSAMAEAVRRG